MMLSPTPLSLLCALLLCLPLAIVFTITTPPTPHSSSTAPSVVIVFNITAPSPPHSSSTTNTTSSSTPHSSSTAPSVAIVFNITAPSPPHSSSNTTSSSIPHSSSNSSTTPSGASAIPQLQTSTATTTSTFANRSAEVRPVLSALVLPAVKTLTKLPNTENTTTNISSPSLSPAADQARNETDDEVEDSSLCQLAGRVNSIPKPPIKKIAFMFLTTAPLPFAPLWELFFNNTPKNLYNIYIHADPSVNYTPPFRGVFARRVIPSKPTRRHSPTLISAARRLLSRALLDDESNYMFALLSPSCIPLRSFSFTYRILSKSRNSFMEILKDEPGAYLRWAARGEDAMLPEVKYEDFRIGSQFFVLKRKHARIVVRDSRLWSKFKLPCSNLAMCYPEEHYFSTLLWMLDPHGCVPATLTHVDWRGSRDGHPRMYHKDEVGPELIRALRKAKPRYGTEGINVSDSSVTRRRDPFLFARKFSPDSIQPLMAIANEIMFKD